MLYCQEHPNGKASYVCVYPYVQNGSLHTSSVGHPWAKTRQCMLGRIRASFMASFFAIAILFSSVHTAIAGAGDEDLAYCYGKYAICASSTCSLTGSTITSKTSDGGSITYPEAKCVCPVINAKFQAMGANKGQMNGSCEQPGKGWVWSIYTPKPRPQAMYNWSVWKDDKLVVEQVCGATNSCSEFSGPQQVNLTYANCFGFQCQLQKPIKVKGGQVRLATCYCPVGSDQDGFPVVPGAAFAHEAGQCNSNYCNMIPVGIPYNPSNSSWQCLGVPPPLPTNGTPVCKTA